MIEYITNFANWYWPNLIWAKVAFTLIPLIYIPYFIASAWVNDCIEFDEDSGVVANMITAFVVTVILSFILSFTWPVVLSALILWGVYYFVNSWGKSYRKVVQSQETKRLSALAQLIKDDPDVKKAYDKLMEEESLNTGL